MTTPPGISVRFSPRARRISLRAGKEDGVVVVVPPRTSRLRIEQALLRHQSWLELRLAEQARRRATWEDLRRGAGEIRIELMGRPMTIRNAGKGSTGDVTAQGNEILVPPDLEGPGRVREMVGRWLHRVALGAVPRRVTELNAPHGFSVSRVQVRDQKTRWGSCSRRGTLSFNWRLVILPTAVMDYLILHELAHTSEMNHSRRFWDLLASLHPDYPAAERWLRANGRTLPW